MKDKNQDKNQLFLFGGMQKESNKPSEDIKKRLATLPKKSKLALKPVVPTDVEELEFQRRARKILNIALEEGLKVTGLVIHDNVHTLASIDKRKRLRLQEVFYNADTRVIRSLMRVIGRKKRKGDNELVNKYLSENPPHRGINGIPISLLKDCYGPFGRAYDLQKILKKVMNKYTGNIDNIMITWRKPTKGRSSITWGSYRSLGDGGLIRINALLDRPQVPEYVVESVVYHELMHHIVPSETDGNVNRVHTRKFREMMSKYPNSDKAEEWKKKYFNSFSRKKRK